MTIKLYSFLAPDQGLAASCYKVFGCIRDITALSAENSGTANHCNTSSFTATLLFRERYMSGVGTAGNGQ